MTVRSRAPTRIDFAGGTTDLGAFRDKEGGAVMSAAIDRFAYCSLRSSGEGAFRIISQDLEEFVEAADIKELEFDGNLDLLKAAVKALALPGGLEIAVRCDAPPGSGIGSSASVGVALLGLLNWLRSQQGGTRDTFMSRFELAELACELEAELGIVGGKQDQYAAALGGFNYMEFYSGGRVAVEPVHISPTTLCELQKHLLLCYSGQSRLSGDTNDRMISAYERGEPVVCEALRTVKRVAQDMYRALLAGNLLWFAELMNEEWEAREKLAPGVVTDKLRELREAAMAEGAIGCKVCGAGGGGCMVILCESDAEAQVRRALEAAGGRILDFAFDTQGLLVWETP